MDTYYTIKQVAAQLNVSRQTIYRWMTACGLEYVQVGGRRRITQTALERFAAPHKDKESADGNS